MNRFGTALEQSARRPVAAIRPVTIACHLVMQANA